jgi:hypothetical protein
MNAVDDRSQIGPASVEKRHRRQNQTVRLRTL